MGNTYIDKLGFVEIKNRRILMTRTFGRDKWYMPGGKREAEETDAQALIREVKEELTVDLISDSIEYYGTFEAQAHAKPKGTMVRITCYRANYNGELRPSSEIEAIDWLDSSDRDDISLIGQLITTHLKESDIID